jgi:hypothetical protein
MSDDLHAYFEKFRAFAEKKNPIRYVGWFFLSACLLMIAALIGPRVLATVKAVVEDIQEVRRRTKEQQSKPTARKGSSPRAKSD